MQDNQSMWIDVAQLRRGLYVQLDLGWMDHPFPKGSFRIVSDEQISTIRSLGLSQVRYFPAQSDAAALVAEPSGLYADSVSSLDEEPSPAEDMPVEQAAPLDEAAMFVSQRREKL